MNLLSEDIVLMYMLMLINVTPFQRILLSIIWKVITILMQAWQPMSKIKTYNARHVLVNVIFHVFLANM